MKSSSNGCSYCSGRVDISEDAENQQTVSVQFSSAIFRVA